MSDWAALEAIGTWVGSVGTAGALFLGFWILRGDRQKEERAQAAQVSFGTVTSMPAKERDLCTIRVLVRNYSTLPIHGLGLKNNYLTTEATVRYELGEYSGDDPALSSQVSM